MYQQYYGPQYNLPPQMDGSGQIIDHQPFQQQPPLGYEGQGPVQPPQYAQYAQNQHQMPQQQYQDYPSPPNNEYGIEDEYVPPPRRRSKNQRIKHHNSRRLRHRTHYRPTRKAYLNTTFDNYTAPNRTYHPNPDNPDHITQMSVEERRGPVDYYPHVSWFNRFENFPGFNRWFLNLFFSGRFTHEYRYDLIDTNYFVGNPETVGNGIFSDQEAVDLQNYEQHFAHLQKVLADEREDQEFVTAYSLERNAHERMLRLRETRNNIFQSILEMERLIYAEQNNVISDQMRRAQERENATMQNITSVLQSLVNVPFYKNKPNSGDIFVN